MGLRIRTNIESLNAQRKLGQTNEAGARSMERLASGYRINRAGDDAAGLAIATKREGSIRSERQAKRNANDGVSMLQVAEGAMNEVSNILIRMKELATQSASDTISDNERDFTNREYSQLIDEIDRISNVTEFTGAKLLQAEQTFEIHVGKGDGSQSNADRIQIEADELETSSNILGVSGAEISSRDGAADQINTIDSALELVASKRATIGAKQNRISSTIRNLEASIENQSAANSRIQDVDYASETANYTQQSILKQGGASVLAQSNMLPELALGLLR